MLAIAPPFVCKRAKPLSSSGWIGPPNIVQEPSGYTNAGGYADGIASATGAFHARLQLDLTDLSCIPGSADCSGPFTRWGGYETVFPAAGYKSSVDIYLDTSFAAAHPDYRFDWDSAVNDSSGNFLQDYVFNAGTNAAGTGFVIGTSTNAGRGSTFPANTCPSPSTAPNSCRAPVEITTSGWYTFQHTFTNVGGFLNVNFKILDSSGTPVTGADWTIFTGHAIAGVGGHRYGWFVNQEINDLAIDNSTLSGLAPTCTPTGFYRDGINLTAAQINPTGTVSGTLNAKGCNIGVYYAPNTTGSVGAADISGANYYGVVVDRASVNVTGATIHSIGETQPNGSQHGVGVLYTTRELTSDPSNTVFTTAGQATGTLSGSTITTYQKGGVVITGFGAAVTMQNNTVTGFGPVDYIAQNGIQISFDATARLVGNTVSLNNYTPPKVTACGLLLYKAGGVSGASKTGLSFIKADNTIQNNETDICNFGKGGGFSPTS